MYVSDPSESALSTAAQALRPQPGDALLVLVGQQDTDAVDRVIRVMAALQLPFLGGVFPGVIEGPHLHHGGVVLARLPGAGEPLIVKDLSRGLPSLATLERPAPGQSATAIVLVDGLSPGLSGLLTALYTRLGDSVSYFGGGAGFHDDTGGRSPHFTQRPCIFSAEGLIEDAAVVAITRAKSELVVGHGWETLKGPLVATRTEGAVIHELNWERPLEAYRRIVEPHAGCAVTAERFFDVAKFYPFGVIKDGDALVRVAIAVTPEGSLVCGGAVLQESVLNVLFGTPETLLAAARAVGQTALSAEDQLGPAMMVDCVSRWMILGDRFEEELAALDEGLQEQGIGGPMLGALSLGEIGSDGSRFMEYLNKTIVVDVLREGRS